MSYLYFGNFKKSFQRKTSPKHKKQNQQSENRYKNFTGDFLIFGSTKSHIFSFLRLFLQGGRERRGKKSILPLSYC